MSRTLKEKNGLRLIETRHANGVLWYQVNSPETEKYSAEILYDGSEKVKAEKIFSQALKGGGRGGDKG